MPPVLGGHGVLQLQRGDGDAVEGQNNIQGFVVPVGAKNFSPVHELARNGEPVGGIECLGVGIHTTGRGEIGHPEQLAEALEPVSQDREAPLMAGVERTAQVVNQRLFGLFFLEIGEVLPFLGLGFLDERNHVADEQAPFGVEAIPVAFFISTGRGQAVFYGGFEGVFRMLTRHQEISFHSNRTVKSLSMKKVSLGVILNCAHTSGSSTRFRDCGRGCSFVTTVAL